MTDKANFSVVVGGSLKDSGKAFLEAWNRSEAGEAVSERVLAFESWDALASVLSGERYKLLKHLHAHPAKSIKSLSESLHRQYRRVHDDVTTLERVGLIERNNGFLRAATDKISTEISLF